MEENSHKLPDCAVIVQFPSFYCVYVATFQCFSGDGYVGMGSWIFNNVFNAFVLVPFFNIHR